VKSITRPLDIYIIKSAFPTPMISPANLSNLSIAGISKTPSKTDESIARINFENINTDIDDIAFNIIAVSSEDIDKAIVSSVTARKSA
jgi:hypothetical protein